MRKFCTKPTTITFIFELHKTSATFFHAFVSLALLAYLIASNLAMTQRLKFDAALLSGDSAAGLPKTTHDQETLPKCNAHRRRI
jgi:hypothetical protein